MEGEAELSVAVSGLMN